MRVFIHKALYAVFCVPIDRRAFPLLCFTYFGQSQMVPPANNIVLLVAFSGLLDRVCANMEAFSEAPNPM